MDTNLNGTAAGERRVLKRLALACFAGSVIEFYDFLIYGTAAALVFPSVFFPNLSSVMATYASLAAFALAFLSRPFGAVFFGHFGDRLGRKRVLVITLLIMGSSTVAIGLLPSQATIGMAAPAILLILRLLQGFAVGGEWAGSVSLSAEFAPPATRGRYGMFTQLGVGAAGVLASLVYLVVNVGVGDHSAAFLSWGWRIPFLFSAVLVAIALYMRLHLEESPVFAQYNADASPPRSPIAALIRTQSRTFVLATVAVTGTFVLSYVSSTYLLNYAHTSLGFSRTLILTAGVLGGLSVMLTTAVSAALSDRFGRRTVILVGLGISVPWSMALMPLMSVGNPAIYVAAVAMNAAIIGIVYGPVAAFLPEVFATSHRFTGTALSFNVAGVFGGGIAPMLSGFLVDSYGSVALGLMMAGCLVISFAATYFLPETRRTSLAQSTAPSCLVMGQQDLARQARVSAE